VIRSSNVCRRRLKELDGGNTEKKTWCDRDKDDVKSFGLSSEDAHDIDALRVRSEAQSANPDLPGKWPIKWFVGCAFLSTVI